MALLLVVSPVVCGPPVLTLEEAFRRVSEAHPDLARFEYLHNAAAAEVKQADQRPPFELRAEVENVLGTGDVSGVDAAEVTLSIASVLERGDKRSARSALARVYGSALDRRQEARRLDLMAEVARRFLDVLAAQLLEGMSLADVEQRQRTVSAAARRVEAGAEPVCARLAAEAAEARARLQLVRTQGQRQIAGQRLSILWGESLPSFTSVGGDLLAIPSVPALQTLLDLLERSPVLKRFADESRLREARLQLARSERLADLGWHVGVRRLESSNEWAAVAGVSFPIGTRARAEPTVLAAQAELSALELEREGVSVELVATLADAYGRLRARSTEADLARDQVLPRLLQAEAAAGRAYEAGALSYLDVSQIQADISSTRRELIEAAIEAHRALIEIQRLTADPFLAKAADRQDPA